MMEITEMELYHAIQDDEFILYFQPQHVINSNEIRGLEALIRWQHPTYGFLTPFQFIPFAEQTGVIVDIGLWVLKRACVQAKKLQIQGYNSFKMIVNVSPIQLLQDDFEAALISILKEVDLSPSVLELEITESKQLPLNEEMKDKIKRLKTLGISLSLDDFGTGYASLSYLTFFSFDTIKIDRFFAKDFNHNTNSSIIEMIVKLGQKLDLNIIAEGVETEEQLRFFEHLKVKYIQGFLLSKPMAIDNIFKNLIPSRN